MRKHILMAALAIILCLPVAAQSNLRNGSLEMIVAPHELTLGSAERTTNFEVRNNIDFTISTDAEWLQVRKAANNRVYLHLDTNYLPEPRTATVTFTNTEKGIQQELTITQKADESAYDIVETDEAMMAEFSRIFKDEALTELKDGVTLANIESLTNPVCKALAMQMFNGTYKKDYRIAKYECFDDPYALSANWNTPGKLYDQMAGVTGIHIPAKSKQVVMVSGIPEGKQVQLKVVAWYVGKVGGNFDGGNPYTSTFELKNGFNLIDYTYEWEGLAYICYYDAEPEHYNDLTVHFVNGIVNGYLSPDKTNDQMYTLCSTAPNMHMDVWGKKVHSVWTSDGLKKYCKDVNGNAKGYRQFMNVLDSLIAWEHRTLGFEKYNRLPRLRTFAYVNYTYYMFQGGLGVTFHVDQESRVLNCKKLITADDDAIWGLSHEWGHQHQMHPYFCWGGLAEVSNNVQSYYNITHMGYRSSDKINSWPSARNFFFDDMVYSAGKKVSYNRYKAYVNRNNTKYSPKMYALCESMVDSIVHPQSLGDMRGVCLFDYQRNYGETDAVGVGVALCPFIMMINYWTNHGLPDFTPDLYESLRQTDYPEGSTIEKKNGLDKYELLARAQNGNLNGSWGTFKEKYPASCWVTDGYITETDCSKWNNTVPFIFNFIRKTSRLTGYNLMPYYEQWGFFRNIALLIGDYGEFWYIMTKEMYDEFKADMDALVASGELKEMPADMVQKISNQPDDFHVRPNIPN